MSRIRLGDNTIAMYLDYLRRRDRSGYADPEEWLDSLTRHAAKGA
jgi:hypothetical protein